MSNVQCPIPNDSLITIAHDFSPRYERHGDHAVVIDISGLGRLFRSVNGEGFGRRASGSGEDDEATARAIGGELQRAAAGTERARVAIASTCTAALVLAHVRAGLTIVARGGEADALAPVPLGVLQQAALLPIRNDHSRRGERIPLSVFRSWGIRTLGELAALPPADLSARLGRPSLIWQAVARGEDIRPLVPMLAEERFESSLELDWPIEGLEPLSFVLTRLLEPLSIRLEQRDRGVAVLHLLFDLVGDREGQEGQEGRGGRSLEIEKLKLQIVGPGRSPAENSNVQISNFTCAMSNGPSPTRPFWSRRLELPFPLRDVRTLRTLALLDLESHPPPAGIERVTIVVEPTPGRVLQHTLFSRAHPTPEQLSTLLSRLGAMLGQDRIGTPAIVDSYRPGAFTMQPFVEEGLREQKGKKGRSLQIDDLKLEIATRSTSPTGLVSAVRRYRVPIPAHVTVERGAPVRVTTRRGFPSGRIVNAAGPWRTSGAWWERPDAQISPLCGSERELCTRSPTPHNGGAHSAPARPGPPTRVVQRVGVETERRGAEGPPRATEPGSGAEPRLSWFRDEWDVALGDGAMCRIFCDGDTGRWFVEAIFD